MADRELAERRGRHRRHERSRAFAHHPRRSAAADRSSAVKRKWRARRYRGSTAPGPAHRRSTAEVPCLPCRKRARARSEEHTSELQSLMRTSYAVFCLKKKKKLSTPKSTKNMKYK